jgi:hypothetical protein
MSIFVDSVDLHQNLGHTRPLCNLAANIVKLRSGHVTLITSPSIVDKVHNELARNFGPDEAETRGRIR